MTKFTKKKKKRTDTPKKLVVHPGFLVPENDIKEVVKAWVGVEPVEVLGLERGEFEFTMSSYEQVQALLMVNQRQKDGTLQKIKVRKAEVLLSVIEVFYLLEDLMVDREELAVRKGPEARTNTVGAEREGANVAPQNSLSQAQTRGGGPVALGVVRATRTPLCR